MINSGLYGKLTVIRNTGTDGNYFPLNNLKTTFGRDPDCDIRLRFVEVSRLHSRISWDKNTKLASIEDLSSNGTMINGSKILHPTVLENNDIISIGERWFRFEYPDDETVQKLQKIQTKANLLPSSPSTSKNNDSKHAPKNECETPKKKSKMEFVNTGKKNLFQTLIVPRLKQETKKSALSHEFKPSPSKSSNHMTLNMETSLVSPAKANSDVLNEPKNIINSINSSPLRVPKCSTNSALKPQSEILQVQGNNSGDKLELRATKMSSKQTTPRNINPPMVFASQVKPKIHTPVMKSATKKLNETVLSQQGKKRPTSEIDSRSNKAIKISNNTPIEKDSLINMKKDDFFKEMTKFTSKSNNLVSKKIINDKEKIISNSGSPKSSAQKRNVSFGPALQPEIFDRRQPPSTPITRGQRASGTDLLESSPVSSLKSILKFKPFERSSSIETECDLSVDLGNQCNESETDLASDSVNSLSESQLIPEIKVKQLDQKTTATPLLISGIRPKSLKKNPSSILESPLGYKSLAINCKNSFKEGQISASSPIFRAQSRVKASDRKNITSSPIKSSNQALSKNTLSQFKEYNNTNDIINPWKQDDSTNIDKVMSISDIDVEKCFDEANNLETQCIEQNEKLDSYAEEKILCTPSSHCEFDEYSGIQELLKTPKKSAEFYDLSGMAEIFDSPIPNAVLFSDQITSEHNNLASDAVGTTPKISYVGIRELVKTPQKTEPIEAHFSPSIFKSSVKNTASVKKRDKTPRNTPRSQAHHELAGSNSTDQNFACHDQAIEKQLAVDDYQILSSVNEINDACDFEDISIEKQDDVSDASIIKSQTPILNHRENKLDLVELHVKNAPFSSPIPTSSFYGASAKKHLSVPRPQRSTANQTIFVAKSKVGILNSTPKTSLTADFENKKSSTKTFEKKSTIHYELNEIDDGIHETDVEDFVSKNEPKESIKKSAKKIAKSQDVDDHDDVHETDVENMMINHSLAKDSIRKSTRKGRKPIFLNETYESDVEESVPKNEPKESIKKSAKKIAKSQDLDVDDDVHETDMENMMINHSLAKDSIKKVARKGRKPKLLNEIHESDVEESVPKNEPKESIKKSAKKISKSEDDDVHETDVENMMINHSLAKDSIKKAARKGRKPKVLNETHESDVEESVPKNEPKESIKKSAKKISKSQDADVDDDVHETDVENMMINHSLAKDSIKKAARKGRKPKVLNETHESDVEESVPKNEPKESIKKSAKKITKSQDADVDDDVHETDVENMMINHSLAKDSIKKAARKGRKPKLLNETHESDVEDSVPKNEPKEYIKKSAKKITKSEDVDDDVHETDVENMMINHSLAKDSIKKAARKGRKPKVLNETHESDVEESVPKNEPKESIKKSAKKITKSQDADVDDDVHETDVENMMINHSLAKDSIKKAARKGRKPKVLNETHESDVEEISASQNEGKENENLNATKKSKIARAVRKPKDLPMGEDAVSVNRKRKIEEKMAILENFQEEESKTETRRSMRRRANA